jgi:adenylyltransferase/sulfurtransferase
MQSDYSERYSRQLRLQGFGDEAQQKLAASKVLVVGAGGLGVPVLQYLAGMGLGHIGIIDDDVVSLSNLHRQVLYTREDIGQPKALVAAARLSKLNPGISIQSFHQRLEASCALSMISAFDIVVDATDNFSARYLINDACVILNKPFVYGAVQAYEGHVSVFNQDGGPTYRCLYPVPPAASEIPDCNTAGVLGVVPGIVGTMQALQVVKLITGISKGLSGYLQVFDFLNDEQFKVKLKADPANKKIVCLREHYAFDSCPGDDNSIQPAILRRWLEEGKTFSIIDVREKEEFEAGHIPLSENVPLSCFRNGGSLSDMQQPIILYCQRGSRSAKALTMLRTLRADIYELAGGYDNWLETQQS